MPNLTMCFCRVRETDLEFVESQFSNISHFEAHKTTKVGNSVKSVYFFYDVQYKLSLRQLFGTSSK